MSINDFDLVEWSERDLDEECFACDFCGEGLFPDRSIIIGNEASICDGCIKTIVELIRNKSNEFFCK